MSEEDVKYHICDKLTLGEPGSFGFVCPAVRQGQGRQSAPLVAKIFHKGSDPAIKTHFDRECAALQRLANEKLAHDSLPAYEHHDEQFAVIIMTRGPSATLDNYIEEDGWTQMQARMVFGRLTSAVSYLHSLGLAHRDIKPANVLIDPATLMIMLVDFGFATDVRAQPIDPEATIREFMGLSCAACGQRTLITASGTMCECRSCGFAETLYDDRPGTPLFMPPELLESRVHSALRADVFAVGLLGYLLFYGHKHLVWFKAKKLEQLRKERRTHGVPVPYEWPGMERNLELFLRLATGDSPGNRPRLCTLFQ